MNELTAPDMTAVWLDLVATLEQVVFAGVSTLVVTVVLGVCRLCAACGSQMQRVFMAAIIVTLTAAWPAAQRGSDLFQKALSKERVDGQLSEAIALYERVVNESSADRALTAKALVQMGRCYERLGKADAKRAYERVVQEFADQKSSATEARARLAALGSANAKAATLTTRQVWTGPKVAILGSISADGRFLSFPNWATGDLGLHDFVTGTDRLLTNNAAKPISQYAEESAISRDGKQVAYSWNNGKRRYELRVLSLQSSGAARPRQVYDNEEVDWMAPYDWSPDGQLIAVQITRKDRTTQIGLVSSRDGSLRVLKSVDWRGVSRMFFSPDGKYLAFDLPVGESQQRDIFALAVDGSREIPAIVHPATDVVIGWAPQGNRLLFSSDRTGVVGLWAIAVSDGRPQGAAALIKADLGRGWSLGVTRTGALFLGTRVNGPNVQIASVDFTTGEVLSTPVNPIPDYVGSNLTPEWSRDGTLLAYVSRRDLGSRSPVIGIRSMETGQIRELRPQLNDFRYYEAPSWAPDGRSLAVAGTDLKGRHGLFQIDAQTGDVSAIVLAQADEPFNGTDWSPDGQRIYYRRGRNAEGAFVERNLASGAEREIVRRRGLGALNLSPDGLWIATAIQDRAAKSSTLNIIRVADGEPRELFRVDAPDQLMYPSWAADSSFVIVCRMTLPASDRCAHWQVPLSDGQARPLNLRLNFGKNAWMSVHPDGHQIAYSSGQDEYEVSVIENFLPVIAGGTTAAARRRRSSGNGALESRVAAFQLRP